MPKTFKDNGRKLIFVSLIIMLFLPSIFINLFVKQMISRLIIQIIKWLNILYNIYI